MASGKKKSYLWLIILATLFGLYLLIGFFALPPLIQYLIKEKIEPELALNIDIAEIKTNPLYFEVDLKGINITETDGRPYLRMERLYTNLSPTKLAEGLIEIDTINMVKPEVNLVVNAQNEINLAQPFLHLSGQSKTPKTKGKNIAWHVKTLKIAKGEVLLTQLTDNGKYQSNTGNLNLTLFDLRSDAKGEFHFGADYDDASPVLLSGNINLEPLLINAKLTLKKLDIHNFIKHPDIHLPVAIDSGLLAADINAHLQQTGDDFSFTIQDSRVELSQLTTSLKDKPLASLKIFALNDISVDSQTQTVNIGECLIEQPEIVINKYKDGSLNLQQIATTETSNKDTEKPAEEKPSAWQVQLNKCLLHNGLVDTHDFAITPPLNIKLADIEVETGLLSTQQDTNTPFSIRFTQAKTGKVSMQGEAQLFKSIVNLSVELKNGRMPQAQAYLNAFTDLKMLSGNVNSKLNIAYNPNNKPVLSVKGDIAINDFATEHAKTKEALLSWKEVKAHDVSLSLEPNNLLIPTLSIQQSDARIAINKQGELNLLTVLKIPENTPKTATKAKAKPAFPIRIKTIAFKESKARFSDDSLLLPFITKITHINGSITPIEVGTTKAVPADVEIKGQIDEFGEAKLIGSLNTNDPNAYAELNLDMSNISLENLSPYSGTFSGYRLAAGKLDTKVNYKVKDHQLDSANSVTIRNIKLGEIVDEEKANALPIELAIALMEDSEGIIALELPIHGDMNNPEFEYSHLIGQAIGNLITKILTAPFALLGNLASGDGDLQFLTFAPGDPNVSLQEQEKLLHLSEALQKRKILQLGVPLCSLKEQDSIALKERALKQEIQKSKTEKLAFLQQKYSTIYTEAATKALEKKHSTGGKKDGELDIVSYLDALTAGILEKTPLPSNAEEKLANERYHAVVSFLTGKGKLAATRIKQGDATQGLWEKDKIQCELALEAGK